MNTKEKYNTVKFQIQINNTNWKLPSKLNKKSLDQELNQSMPIFCSFLYNNCIVIYFIHHYKNLTSFSSTQLGNLCSIIVFEGVSVTHFSPARSSLSLSLRSLCKYSLSHYSVLAILQISITKRSKNSQCQGVCFTPGIRANYQCISLIHF